MKTKKPFLVLIIGINIILCHAGCKKDDSIYFTTLEKLYYMDKYVEISECTYNGKRVYSVFPNAYDAGADVYDDKGRRIAQCGWAKGRDYDRMIAAHAISSGSILVTANETDFRDIPGLSLENWTVPT